MKNRITSAQSGFTLVELIVVIIILAILGAVALPKFMDVTEKAQISAVKGAGGGLGAGIALAHAQWVANGETSADTDGIAGFGQGDVVTNDAGWPTGTTASNDTCLEIWQGVMQGPPTIDTDAVAAASGGVEYGYTEPGTPPATCTYTYYGGSKTATAMSIQYNPADGSVTVDSDP